jgi:hypothetical protein
MPLKRRRRPAEELKAIYDAVLKQLNSFPAVTDRIRTCEALAKSIGRKPRELHESVASSWRKSNDPTILCMFLDKKVIQLTVERDKRLAEGKSLHKPNDPERTRRYLDLAINYLLRNYSVEELERYGGDEKKNCRIAKSLFEHCDAEFRCHFPAYFQGPDALKQLKVFRGNIESLRVRQLITKALLIKQGTQDPSSSQTGDLSTPSCHGLGLLAMAASNAADSLHLDVEPPKDSRSLVQLLQTMDPRQESDIPDSDNDGRGASESLCSSDGYDDPGKDPPSSGSGERTRQSAFACSGRSKGDRLRAQFMRSMIERFKEIPELTDSGSEDESRLTRPNGTRPLSATGGRRAAPRDSADARAAAGAAAGAAAATGAAGGGATASLESAFPCQIGDGARSAAAGADAGGVGGAQAGGVGGAQASGTGGELTFTESLPLCLNRLTAARADWQPPPICQCRSID